MIKRHNCTQMRRVLITHGTFNMHTGERDANTRTEWETRACGVPLFGDKALQRGTCDSCASGWTHEHNYPVTDKGE